MDTQKIEVGARALASDDLFAALSEDYRIGLLRQARFEVFAKDDVLMRQGETGDFACLILDGTVTINVDSDLGLTTVAELGSGQLVGELAAFSDAPRTATVIAASRVDVAIIDRQAIRQMLRDNPDLALSVIGELGGRINEINATLATLTRAVGSLGQDSFDPRQLDDLSTKSKQLGLFASAFRALADELREKRRLAHEMETAEAIQRAFLPKSPPQTPYGDSFDIASAMTAARHVGGDFYDYFMVDDTRLGFAVGDVAGKGIPAALFMSLSRIVLRVSARQRQTAASTMARVNDILAEDNAESMFVTLGFGILDLKTGVLDYASGAHEEVFVLRSGGGHQQLGRTGPAVALFEGAEFTGETIQMHPGDILLCLTDGVTEAFNPTLEIYGMERLENAIQNASRDSSDALLADLADDLAGFVDGAPPSDDVTLSALRYLGWSNTTG